jgi:hypothetical protein
LGKISKKNLGFEIDAGNSYDCKWKYLLQHSRSILCKFFIFVLRITSYSELSFYTLIVLKQYLSQQQERVKDKIYKDSLLDSYKYTEQLAEDYFSCIEEGRDN